MTGIAESSAIRLAELSREIDELEGGRASLLSRLDRLRAHLLAAGQRTAAMRASVELLCEHINNVVMAVAELRAIEEEIKEMGGVLDASEKEGSALAFESGGFQETLDETEDELERLSTIIIEGKAKHPRGH